MSTRQFPRRTGLCHQHREPVDAAIVRRPIATGTESPRRRQPAEFDANCTALQQLVGFTSSAGGGQVTAFSADDVRMRCRSLTDDLNKIQPDGAGSCVRKQSEHPANPSITPSQRFRNNIPYRPYHQQAPKRRANRSRWSRTRMPMPR